MCAQHSSRLSALGPPRALEFSSLPTPHVNLQACVIIPARDESENIERTLDHFTFQRDAHGTPLDPTRFEILLGCNNCRDDTASKARDWGSRHPHIVLHVIEMTFEPAHANIGWARRTLMNAAYHRFSSLPPTPSPQVICSTDADTRVFPDWIGAILDEVVAGAEAIGGRIYVERGSDLSTRRTYLLDTAYRLSAAHLESRLDPQPHNPWPRHFQFFGANLAVTTAAYALVGGLPPVACLEDMALERQLLHHDVPIRHAPRVAVRTSSRVSGRVGTGLSTQLLEWQGTNSAHWMVPSGREIAMRAQTRRRLRNLFDPIKERPNQMAWQQVAEALMLCPEELQARTRAATYFGALWDEVWETAWSNPQFRERWQPIAVEEALEELRLALASMQPVL